MTNILSFDDVLERIPFKSRKTLKRFIDERRIPMIKIFGRWTISQEHFARVAAEGFPLPEGHVFRADSEKYKTLKWAVRKHLLEQTEESLCELTEEVK